MEKVLAVWIIVYVATYFYWQIMRAWLENKTDLHSIGLLVDIPAPRTVIASLIALSYWLWTC